MTGCALELTKVCKQYRRGRNGPNIRALQDVSLSLEAAKWLVLLGPNGSGKSTLMRILATLETQDSGSVRVFGLDLPREFRSVRAKLGVVFQAPGLDKLLTVEENFIAQGALVGLRRSDSIQRARELGAQFGLSDRFRDRVGRLSGGLVRRVDLARALLSRPALLLLDEPTSGLDLSARQSFFQAIRAHRESHPVTIVMSTHLMEEADHADVVHFMTSGSLVASGSPADLRSRFGQEIILNAPATAESVFKAHDLLVRHIGAELAATGSVESVRAASVELMHSGIPFRYGPTTLGDAYLAATGSTLTAMEPIESNPVAGAGARSVR